MNYATKRTRREYSCTRCGESHWYFRYELMRDGRARCKSCGGYLVDARYANGAAPSRKSPPRSKQRKPEIHYWRARIKSVANHKELSAAAVKIQHLFQTKKLSERTYQKLVKLGRERREELSCCTDSRDS